MPANLPRTAGLCLVVVFFAQTTTTSIEFLTPPVVTGDRRRPLHTYSTAATLARRLQVPSPRPGALTEAVEEELPFLHVGDAAD